MLSVITASADPEARASYIQELAEDIDHLRALLPGEWVVGAPADAPWPESAHTDVRVDVSGSPAEVRSRLLEVVSGDIIMSVDDDDRIDPSVVSRLYALAVSHRCLVAGWSRDMSSDGTEFSDWPQLPAQHASPATAQVWRTLHPSAVLWPAQALHYDTTLPQGEDLDALARAHESHALLVCEEFVHFYRKHTQSLMHQPEVQARDEEILREVLARYPYLQKQLSC